MNKIELLTPFLESGIRNSNFFNGRLLTAEALQTEQLANRQQRRLLGQAIGSGVVDGLEVSVAAGPNSSTVQVTKGLAVNREGEVLCLPKTVDVSLVPEEEEIAGGEGLFSACQPVTDEFYNEAGVYLLAIAPASSFSIEQAPMQGFHGINGGATAANCSYRYAREGVQFKLVRIDVGNADVVGDLASVFPGLLAASTAAEISRLRNLMAHASLGTLDVAKFVRDLYSHLAVWNEELTYGLAERLRKLPTPRLKECDMPLALIYWTGDGIRFVDMWSVRRRLTGASTHSATCIAGDRRLAEGEATFLQFQEQIAYITRPTVTQSELSAIRATDYFHLLPAVGIIPLTGTASARGLDYLQFFFGLTTRPPIFIEGVKVQYLIHRSFHYAPINLSSGELIWLYLVRENLQPDIGTAVSPAQPYLLFSRGNIPFQGDAQFDLAHWNYGNYGDVVAGDDTIGG